MDNLRNWGKDIANQKLHSDEEGASLILINSNNNLVEKQLRIIVCLNKLKFAVGVSNYEFISELENEMSLLLPKCDEYFSILIWWNVTVLLII